MLELLSFPLRTLLILGLKVESYLSMTRENVTVRKHKDKKAHDIFENVIYCKDFLLQRRYKVSIT